MGNVNSHAPHSQSLALPHDIIYDKTMCFDMKDLSILAGVNRELRTIIKEILEARFIGALSKFIHAKHTATFKLMLNDTRSVVGGSIAQAVITPRIFDNDRTSNLNIFCRAGTLHVWEDYLGSIGYIHTSNATKKFIMVSESSCSSALIPILSSSYTSQMNFITANHVYSIHPVLTRQMKTLALTQALRTVKNSTIEKRLKLRGIKVVSVKKEQKLCQKDSLCRCVIRFLGKERKDCEKVNYTDLVGIMCWGSDGVKECFLHEKRIRFWLGGSCRNEDCMYKPYIDDREDFEDL
ncbi:hypothetical protein GALMADRAFT_229152 [Galerina marginata CBS 339.88]|uniref:Uncharacterized protein n=1 Tax=Galerina marginata (strain CBS 339.88) TaxID=685588 RepID=A0A067T038_GALM3|nr:hypothetical protein GALMADRAFT_229152 [Galerina marginata CBS 339.88]